MLLTDDLRKGLWPILASKHEIGHRSCGLYPAPPTLQRHGLADLFRLDDRLVPDITELVRRGVLVERSPADQFLAAEHHDRSKHRHAAAVGAFEIPGAAALAVERHRQ